MELQKGFLEKCLDKWIPIHEIVMYPPALVLLISAILVIGGIHWQITHGMVSGFITYCLISLLGFTLIVEAGARLYYRFR